MWVVNGKPIDIHTHTHHLHPPYNRTTMNLERVVALCLLLGMFVWSGGQKVLRLGYVQTKQFVRFGMPLGLAAAVVLLAGLWELGSVAAIVSGEVTGRKSVVRRGIEALMLFTVAATFLFKLWPKVKWIQIAANASVLGGLALYHMCSR